MSNRNTDNELEGLHLDILNDYIEKGVTPDDMEPEMQQYLLQLQFIQQRFNRVESPSNVINSLVLAFPDMTITKAKSRFNDALRFFHLDPEESKDALRNWLFDVSMKVIQLSIRTVKNPKEAVKIVDAIKKAYEIKGLHLPDKTPIPKELLEERIEIFSLNPSDVGLPEANRQLIAQQIEQFPIQEEQKLRIKMDAGLMPKEIFKPNHEQTEDESLSS